MAKKVLAQFRGKTLEEALFGKGEQIPLSKLKSWKNVSAVVCPHCGTYVRFSFESLEELLIPTSDYYENDFKEYCYECGKKICFPTMKNFGGK